MDKIRAYILSVTAAAIFCAVICTLVEKNNALTSIIKLMTGVVMAAVVISPMADLSVINLRHYLDTLNADALAAVDAGTSAAREAAHSRISASLESYILDKAAQLSLDINIDLILEDESMIPVAVVLEGAASPYAKNQLETLLQDELGIPREALTWK